MSGALSEHHGYLSTARRLDHYRAAVARVVRPGDTVADLGCGFGILGLLCLEAGAGRVLGIDSTDAIEIARETMSREGFADRYQCLRESTFRAEVSEPVDVLICDHVGYFGIDYGIVAMLDDARQRVLKPGGRIIPESLDLLVAGIASPGARSRLDAWRQDDVPPAYGWLSSYAANTRHGVTFETGEIATSPVTLGSVDLTRDSPEVLSFAATLAARADGALDGLGGWFDCRLAPGVTMTNAPGSPERIARSQVLLGFDAPLPAATGDAIAVKVRFRHEDGIILWTARNDRTGETRRQSTWASLPLSVSGRLSPSRESRCLSPSGKARAALLALVDGSRNGSEIEAEMRRLHSGMFPTEAELVRFVRDELAWSAR